MGNGHAQEADHAAQDREDNHVHDDSGHTGDTSADAAQEHGAEQRGHDVHLDVVAQTEHAQRSSAVLCQSAFADFSLCFRNVKGMEPTSQGITSSIARKQYGIRGQMGKSRTVGRLISDDGAQKRRCSRCRCQRLPPGPQSAGPGRRAARREIIATISRLRPTPWHRESRRWLRPRWRATPVMVAGYRMTTRSAPR